MDFGARPEPEIDAKEFLDHGHAPLNPSVAQVNAIFDALLCCEVEKEGREWGGGRFSVGVFEEERVGIGE